MEYYPKEAEQRLHEAFESSAYHKTNYAIERRAICLVLPTFWQAVTSITKYTIIPNPNPNPNTKMTVTLYQGVILCILIVVTSTDVRTNWG